MGFHRRYLTETTIKQNCSSPEILFNYCTSADAFMIEGYKASQIMKLDKQDINVFHSKTIQILKG
jgi:hypothetical protein